MSVTKPYLYSLLTRLSTDELMSSPERALKPHVVFAGAAAVQLCVSRRSTSAPSTSARNRASAGADLGGKRSATAGNGAVVLGERAAAGQGRHLGHVGPPRRALGPRAWSRSAGGRANQLGLEPAGEAPRNRNSRSVTAAATTVALDHSGPAGQVRVSLVAPGGTAPRPRGSAGTRTQARRRRGARARTPPGPSASSSFRWCRAAFNETPSRVASFLGRQALGRALSCTSHRAPAGLSGRGGALSLGRRG